MTSLEAALRNAARALRAAGLRWAVVGGLAVSARAEPRTTRDVDLAVAVDDDAAAEAALYRLQVHGLSVVSVVEQTARHRLATARLHSSDERIRGIFVDLLFASSGIEPEVVNRAEEIELVPGLSVPVARTGHLVALKALARNDRDRPQDLDDIRALLREATTEDVDEARDAVRLIEERGFARGRKLSAELEDLLARERR
ncbi:MAG TPA: nucleotidyl transferase AbiEii/AbiGii toxin family protein [Thermoanaerobaculia bacterium]|nr:nucleotidyl transferase AbiEii/AbiGii toxin family protein [Thermoanaerobaculia bacterium]